MKKTLKLLSFVLLVSTLSLVNCHKYETGGSDAAGAILANYINRQIQAAITGNCAISLNFSGVWYGKIIESAVNGGIGNPHKSPAGTAVTTQTASTFDMEDYNSVESVQASSGSWSWSSTTTPTLISYNRRYDAFFKTSSTWTLAARNAALSAARRSMLGAATYGVLPAVCAATSNTASGATLQGAILAFYATLNAAEKAEVDAFLTVLGTTISALGTAAAAITCANYHTSPGIANALGGIFGGSAGSNACALNGSVVLTSCPGFATGGAAFLTAIASGYTLRSTLGTAVLACTRLPNSSCSAAALTTPSSAVDIGNQVYQSGAISANSACAKPTTNFQEAMDRFLMRGLSPYTVVQGMGVQGNFTNSGTNSNTYGFSKITTGTGSGVDTFPNKILADAAYPKFGKLVDLGFGSLMPMKTGTTAYTSQTDSVSAATDATAFINGSNMNVVTVGSCESLGLGTGIVPNPANTSRQSLSPIPELIYAFSNYGGAASAYAAMIGTAGYDGIGATGPTTAQATACNKYFRIGTKINPLVGNPLPDMNSTSGDGGATQALSLCLYGGTSSTRAATAAVMNSGLGLTTATGIQDCQASALTGSSVFGEAGLQSFTSYPNGN